MISFKSKTVKWSIVIGGCIVGFLVLHFFVGGPSHRRLENYKELLKQKQKKISEIESLMSQYPDPQKSMLEIQKKQEVLDRKFISERDLPRAMQLLTEKSSEFNIEMTLKPVREIGFKELPLPQEITKLYLEMEVRTTYTALGDYLKTIEDLPITFTIESLHVEKEEDDEGRNTGRVLAVVLISSYSIRK